METCHLPVIYATIKQRKLMLTHTGKLSFTCKLCLYSEENLKKRTRKIPFTYGICDDRAGIKYLINEQILTHSIE